MLRLVGFTKYRRAGGRASDVLDVPRMTRDALYGTTRKAEYQWRPRLNLPNRSEHPTYRGCFLLAIVTPRAD